ncbi:MAG: DUF1571 domain-containing protein, partial [Planctomycetaceae bacterium]|nr:DUF1571 domain-containing protein [Planctomycetaceae bacterium]
MQASRPRVFDRLALARSAPLLAALAFMLTTTANAQQQIAARIDEAPATHPLLSALKIGREAATSLDDVDDYEATFVKKEIIGGRLVEQQMQIRFREEPKSVRLKFINPHPGREVVYVAGRNNNKLQVKDSGLIALVGPVSLDPTSSLAMQETVHPITEIGIRNMLHRLLEHWLDETSHDDIQVQVYPNAKI